MLISIALAACAILPQEESDTLFVITTLPYIADVVQQVGGERVEAISLVSPGVDPHHVEVTPAQLTQLRGAGLFLENGMQLEAWVPRVLEVSGRADLAQGAFAHAFVTNGISPLEVPSEEELHAGGDVHAAGNPHAWLDPLNLKVVAGNVAQALSKVAPAHSDEFRTRRVAFDKRIDSAFFGEQLEGLLGGRTLDRLHRSGRLFEFLEGREVKGEKLIGKLGGWLGRARELSGRRVMTYHSTWSYMERTFGLEVVATLEEKPGIPPGPAYLNELSELARSKGVQRVLAPPFYPTVRIEGFAERIGGAALILPTQPGEAPGADDVFLMFDTILTALESQPVSR